MTSSEEGNTYVIDAESATEMARLMLQDRLLTQSMGGVFSERTDNLEGVQRVLDIGCGPGGWVLDVAFAYPKMEVVGIDTSKIVVEYARAQAWSRGLNNATFKLMSALEPLDFADASFDLVNGRSLYGFMPPDAWPALLQECMRITRPGGFIRITDTEMPLTNSPAAEKLTSYFTLALKRAGQSFSPDGRHVGILPMLKRLLSNAGYQDIQHKAYCSDASAGSDRHAGFYHDLTVAYKLLEPFLIRMGLTTEEEFDRLYQHMQIEIMQNDFCAMLFLLTAWGYRP